MSARNLESIELTLLAYRSVSSYLHIIRKIGSREFWERVYKTIKEMAIELKGYT